MLLALIVALVAAVSVQPPTALAAPSAHAAAPNATQAITATAARLAAALPPTPAGFEREDQPAQDGELPSVGVVFKKLVRKAGGGLDDIDNYTIITVSIMDAGASEGWRRESFTPAGPRQQAVKVRGQYPGKEEATASDLSFERCSKAFLVADRYVVIIAGENTRDLALVNAIIDGMKLDSLKK